MACKGGCLRYILIIVLSKLITKKRKGDLEQKTEKEVIKKDELWKQKKTLKSALTASVIPTHKGRNRSIGTKLQTQSNRRNRGGVSFK